MLNTLSYIQQQTFKNNQNFTTMNISNINSTNGIIYFHANSIPYHLENMNNEYVINKILKNQEGFELSDYELEHIDFVNECEQYLESYILELKSDWIEILESDTDNYLSEIDSAYFDSEFCTITENEGLFSFYFKVNNRYVHLLVDNETQIITEYKYCMNTENCDYDLANEFWVSYIRNSKSFLSHLIKETLIRSHQEFLHELSKKQVVVI